MRKYLAIASVLVLGACSGLPNTCDTEDVDLDCGVGAYSEERTVLFEVKDEPAPAPVVEAPKVMEPAPEPVAEPVPAPAPEPDPIPTMEPVQGTADKVFDDRLRK